MLTTCDRCQSTELWDWFKSEVRSNHRIGTPPIGFLLMGRLMLRSSYCYTMTVFPSCCASLFSSSYCQSGSPLGSLEPSAVCLLTLYLCLREARWLAMTFWMMNASYVSTIPGVQSSALNASESLVRGGEKSEELRSMSGSVNQACLIVWSSRSVASNPC